MAEINARFRYEGNFGPLQAQIRSLTRDIGLLNASFVAMDKNANATRRAIAESFSSNLAATGQFRTAFVDLTNSTEEFGRALQKNKLTMRQYFSEARRAYRQDSMTRRLADQQVRMLQSQMVDLGVDPSGRRKGMLITPLRLDTKDFSTKMQLATQQYAIFNKLVQDGATSLINWGKNTQWAGRQLTVGLTVPLTLFGVAVSKTFRDVDKELTRFAKVYGSDLVSANKDATEKMKQQIQELAVAYSSTYGIAAKETIALAADIAATGREGQQLLDSVAQTTRLAVLGEVERQEAMQTTLSLQSAFKMNTKELADAINFLNAVENQTSTSLQDFTAAIPKSGPVVRALGGDIKDLALMLTAMREGGIPAAEAANAIKSGLASLINPTKAASERLQQFGIDIQGIVQRNRGELMPTLFEFQSVLQQLDSFGRAKVIEELFGKYQFARISALFDNLNRQGSQTVEVMNLMRASSADLARTANQEISTMTESVSMRFTRAIEGFKAALLPIGEVLTSSVIPFIEGASNAVGKMVEIFNNLPGPLKSGTKLLLGFAAVAGPLVMLSGVFANFIGYIIKGTMNLNNFARMLIGLPVQKFELLDDQTIATAKSTDILTASFQREADSLRILNQQLFNYSANLRRAASSSPSLFVPGSPARPVRRSTGGDIPGYGGGDKVPALLEPGEFVVRKEVANKNRGFLRSLNSGVVKGFNKGGDVTNFAHTVSSEDLGQGNKRFFAIGFDVDKEINKRLNGQGAPLTKGEFISAISDPKAFGTMRTTLRRELGIPDVVLDRYMMEYRDELIKRVNQYPSSTILDADLFSMTDEISRGGKGSTLVRVGREVSVVSSGMTISKLKELFGVDTKKAKKYSSPVEFERETGIKAPGVRPGEPELGFKEGLGPGSRWSTQYIPASGTSPAYVIQKEKSGKTSGVWGSGYNVFRVNPDGTLTNMGRSKSGGRMADIMRNQIEPLVPSVSPSQRRPAPGAGQTRNPASLMPGEMVIPPDDYKNGAVIDRNGRLLRFPGSPFAGFRIPFLDNGGVANARGGFDDYEVYDINTRQRRTPDPRFLNVNPADVDGPMDRQMRGARAGNALMSVGFAGSMLSGMTAMNGEVTAATTALTAFTTALMVAGAALELKSMLGGPGGMMGRAGGKGFLGLKGAGAAMQARGASTAAGAAGSLGRLGGMGLLTAGRGVAMLGGPVGIGIAAALTIGILAYQKNEEALENMRKSAKASFAEASQSAEYFGVSLEENTEKTEQLRDTVSRMGVDFRESADNIDEDFIQRVGSDYEDLINKMSGRKDVEGIARDFELAYSSLISKGFGQSEANEILEEVARQAQQTEVYINVKGRWQGIDTPEAAAASIVENTVASLAAAQEFLDPEKTASEYQTALSDLISSQKLAREELFATLNAQYEAGTITPSDMAGQQAALAARQLLERESLNQQYFGNNPDVQAAKATIEMFPEQAGAALKALMDSYRNAPGEIAPIIDQLNTKISDSFQGNVDLMTRYGGQIQEQFREAVGDDPYLMQVFDKIPNTLEGIQQKTLLLQTVNLGLSGTIYSFVDGYELAADALEELVQKTIMLNSLNQEFDASLESGIEDLTQVQKDLNEQYDDRIKKQNRIIKDLGTEAETAQETYENTMDGLEAEAKALDKRADKIRDNADAQQELIDKQIDSLRVKQDEINFDREQRDRAFGMLGALASGDFGGYEQARLDYVQAQEDRSRELSIRSLEQRKENIQEEAQAKLDAINKEREAIDERRDAAAKAHEEYMKQNRENVETAQGRIKRIEKERVKVTGVIQEQINLLQNAKDQGYLTETQVKEINEKLNRMSLKLPEATRTALRGVAEGLFGPNGEYTRVVNGLVSEMATALNVTEEDVRNMLGATLVGQYSDPNRAGAEGRNGQTPPPGRTGESPIPGRAMGGKIEGPGTATSDSIPVRLSRGEYVIRASSVNKLGTDTLDRINQSGEIPRYAEGGAVDGGGLWGATPNAMTILSIRALQDLYNATAANIRGTSTTGNVPAGEGSQWLANFLASQGLSGEKLRVAYAIAMRESSGRPNLVSTMDGNGYGLFQIQFGVGHANTLNTVLGSNVTDSESDRQKFAQLMFDPINNFKVMMHMSRNMEDLGAWGLTSWSNPSLNTRDYSKWTSSQHQAWIMEPFLRYYAQFPGVNLNYGTTTGSTTLPGTGTVAGGNAAPGPAGAGRTLSGWPAIPPSVSGSYLTMTNSPNSNREFYVAKWAVPMFEALMAAWQSNPNLGGGRLNLNSGSSGSYDYRQARASSGWSDHAGGVAVDFRYDVLPAFSGYQMTSAERSAVGSLLSGPLGKVFGWGGNYSLDYMDEMHFYVKPNSGIIPSFANGGLVGDTPGFYSGGYISADRAETAASGNKYLGGYTPKPASSVGKYGWKGDPTARFKSAGQESAGRGFSLMYQGLKNSINQKGLWSTLGSMVSGIAADPASLIPFYGMSSIDTSTQEGRDMLSSVALMEILGVIPGAGIGFKGASLLGRSAARTIPRIPTIPVPAIRAARHKGLKSNEFRKQKELWMNQSFPRRSVRKDLESGAIYGSNYMTPETKAELLRSIPLTSRYPMLFHGSPNPTAKFSTPTAYQLSKPQLGPYGIYNTNSLYAASRYARGATNYARPGAKPAIMRTMADIKPFDLMPYGRKIPSEVLDSIDSTMGQSRYLKKVTREELETAARQWDAVGYSGVDRIHFINDLAERYVPEGMTVQDAQMSGMFQSIKNEIAQAIVKSGYSSIRHEGGAIMGDRRHTVNILLEPEKYEYDAFYRLPEIPDEALMADGGIVKKFARGGLGTSTSDSILARVSNGEYVMNAKSVDRFGVKFMDKLNAGEMPKFKTGGLIGGPKFKVPAGKEISSQRRKETQNIRGGDMIEYNINIEVANTNASPEDIANRVMRQLRSNQNARRLN